MKHGGDILYFRQHQCHNSTNSVIQYKCDGKMRTRNSWCTFLKIYMQLGNGCPQSETSKKSGRVCTKAMQRIVKFQILDFCHLSLAWDHMRVKVSNDISGSTHQSHSTIFMYTLREGLYQNLYKIIVRFQIVSFGAFFVCSFLDVYRGTEWGILQNVECILKKPSVVERSRTKFGLRGKIFTSVYSTLLTIKNLMMVWGYSVHLGYLTIL